MRKIVVPELRRRWPSARIIHELPLRYSTNRVDLAAVTTTEIISVEIKSSKDVSDRLEAQLRAFVPISSRVIVALAPIWNEELPNEVFVTKQAYKAYRRRFTEAQQIIENVGEPSIETWTVDAARETIEVTREGYYTCRPWLARMLDVLHVAELVEIAGRHRCWQGGRPTHAQLVDACVSLMTGREITAAVCGALRARDAFGAASDPPIGLYIS